MSNTRNSIKTFQPSVEDYDALIAKAKSEDKIGPWVIGRTLGEGSFGKVKIGIHEQTKQKVALKFIRKDFHNYNRHQTNLEREKKITKLLDHPNIVHLYDVYELPTQTVLVLEYVKGMELFDYIVANKRLKESEAIKFFRQMVCGIEYCHSNLVIHRDLKPENLLLDVDRNIKIADFGLSNLMTPGRFFESFCGSPLYSSPEVIEKVSYIGPEVDVWAMGVILYAMVTGYIPWDGDDLAEQLRNAMNGNFRVPSFVSKDCANLIGRMLCVDPKKRATLSEIRQHPWTNNGHKTLLPAAIPVVPSSHPLDEQIVGMMEGLGFNPKEVAADVLHGEVNKQTFVIYNLIWNRKKKEQMEIERRKQEEAERIRLKEEKEAAEKREAERREVEKREAARLAAIAEKLANETTQENLNITIEKSNPNTTVTITITQKANPNANNGATTTTTVTPSLSTSAPTTPPSPAIPQITPPSLSTSAPIELPQASSPQISSADIRKKRLSVGATTAVKPNSIPEENTNNGGQSSPNLTPEGSPSHSASRGIKAFLRRSFGNLRDHADQHGAVATGPDGTATASTAHGDEGLKVLKMKEFSSDTTSLKSTEEVKREVERGMTLLGMTFKLNEKGTTYKVRYVPPEHSANPSTVTASTPAQNGHLPSPVSPQEDGDNKDNEQRRSPFSRRKQHEIKFKLSVCHVQNTSAMKGLKFKRTKGELWQYKSLVERLVGELHL